jgi:GT2 family glycosyltransferase
VAYASVKPVVGYYGAISDWFDMELLVKMANRYPDWQFLMVGEVTHPSPKAAMHLPNVTFTGEVPYEALPSYLYSFNICVIPFLINELTLCTNPVKIYEYLAAGKPVVTTNMPELRMIDDICHVCDDHEEFLGALETAMEESKDVELAAVRRSWAMQHDWDQRAGLLERAISDAWPKVSVIVLTYNNLAFTRACLESVEKHSRYPNLELIIVDNASTDETPAFLRQYASDHPSSTVILNEQNVGFAAGNNVGLRAATGDFLIMLNNDTYVTDGWVHGLIRHFRQHPQLGLIGPVTNNIGNEAKIDMSYETMAEMLTEARRYTSAHTDDLLFIETIAFFCVAMRRRTYETVGELDEDFALGFFEDDDYCRRVKLEGLDIAVANDVFVHHHMSASFDKLGHARKQELFEANKAVYENKWGKWTPHRYR